MMQNDGAGFLSGAAGGFFGSLGATAWGGAGGEWKGIGGKYAGSSVGTIAFGALSGGVGAELSGGNFWQGAIAGGIVAGLNDVMHEMDGPRDPTKRVSSKKFSKTKVTYLLAEDVGLAGSFTVSGTVVTSADSDSNVLNIRVGASGTTLADMRGNVTFGGDVELMINNKVVARSNFQIPKGDQVYQSATHPMGTAEFNVPNSASNVRINIRASYIFDNNGLRASPISSSFQSILIRR